MAFDLESTPAHRHRRPRSSAAIATGVAVPKTEQTPRDGGFRAACELQDRRFADAMLRAHPELWEMYAGRAAIRAALVLRSHGVAREVAA